MHHLLEHINTAPTMQKQCCLFSDPVICLYIIVLFKHPLYFRKKILFKLTLVNDASSYDFSTPYTTLSHNLIKDKFIDLIERTFQGEGSPYLACNDRNSFYFRKPKKNILHGRVKMYVIR